MSKVRSNGRVKLEVNGYIELDGYGAEVLKIFFKQTEPEKIKRDIDPVDETRFREQTIPVREGHLTVRSNIAEFGQLTTDSSGTTVKNLKTRFPEGNLITTTFKKEEFDE